MCFAHYVSFKAVSTKRKRSLEILEIQNFLRTNLLSSGFFIKTNQAEHFCALVSSAGEGGGKKEAVITPTYVVRIHAFDSLELKALHENICNNQCFNFFWPLMKRNKGLILEANSWSYAVV